MRINIKSRWRVGVLIFLVIFGPTVFAADKTMFVLGTGIQRAGSNLTAPNANIIFTRLRGGASASLALLTPGTRAPITDFTISAGAVNTLGSPAGRNILIDCQVGDNLFARIWTPGVGSGNYYGDATLAMTQPNFDDSALTWNWTSLAVDYKAAAPYQPDISHFCETTTTYTDSRPSVSNLIVYSAPGRGTDGLREINSYAWKFWQPADPDHPAADEPTAVRSGAVSPSLILDSSTVVSGRTYAFRVNHGNQWSPAPTGGTWSTIRTYQVAGGAGSVPGSSSTTTTYNLQYITDKSGINQIAFPFTNISSPAAIANARELINAVNSAAGENVVTAFGWWDVANQRPAGYIVTYNSSTLNDISTSLITAGSAPANPATYALGQDRAYQISVLKTANLTLTGTRGR